MRAVVLAGLGVGAERTGVVVADHDDEAGSDDGEKGLQLGRRLSADRSVAVGDGAQRATDLPDVLWIEDGGVVVEAGRRAHRRHPAIT